MVDAQQNLNSSKFAIFSLCEIYVPAINNNLNNKIPWKIFTVKFRNLKTFCKQGRNTLLH